MDLGRWPVLLIAGRTVTPDQADEILLRTNWGVRCPDRDWQAAAWAIMGITGRRITYRGVTWNPFEELESRQLLGGIDLEYLTNHRIMSTSMDGTDGWCDWDGTVGGFYHVSSKSPSVMAITDEWQLIAAAFPYLSLRAQAITEDDSRLEWRVSGGRAALLDETGTPIDAETLPDNSGPEYDKPGWGTGVSLDRLEHAVQHVMKDQHPEQDTLISDD